MILTLSLLKIPTTANLRLLRSAMKYCPEFCICNAQSESFIVRETFDNTWCVYLNMPVNNVWHRYLCSDTN